MKRREAVREFADQMENQLRRNDHKGENGWLGCDKANLVEALLAEVGELMYSMLRGEKPQRVIHEAADVANFCMMIADNEAHEWNARNVRLHTAIDPRLSD